MSLRFEPGWAGSLKIAMGARVEMSSPSILHHLPSVYKVAKLFENWQWNRNKLFYIEINSAKPNDIPRILGVSIAMSNMAKQDLSQNPKTIKQMAWGILQAA